MKTKIKTIHEEKITNSYEQKKIIGVLFNYSIDSSNLDWKETLFYLYNYNTQTYIFFKTITELINYTFYGNFGTLSAILTENEFDVYYDAKYINDKFSNLLEWTQ